MTAPEPVTPAYQLPTCEQVAPTIEAAHEMGATGGPVVEAERLAFEAWMKGHCWSLGATWRGTQYQSDAEVGGHLDPHAIRTRELWAAWRDRAALAFAAGQSAEPEHIKFLRRWLIDTASESSAASRPEAIPGTDEAWDERRLGADERYVARVPDSRPVPTTTGADVLTEADMLQLGKIHTRDPRTVLQAAARIGAERERERAARVCEAAIRRGEG